MTLMLLLKSHDHLNKLTLLPQCESICNIANHIYMVFLGSDIYVTAKVVLTANQNNGDNLVYCCRGRDIYMATAILVESNCVTSCISKVTMLMWNKINGMRHLPYTYMRTPTPVNWYLGYDWYCGTMYVITYLYPRYLFCCKCPHVSCSHSGGNLPLTELIQLVF